MDLDRESRIQEGFLAAVRLPASDRGPFLDVYCAGNPDLREEIESLLQHDREDTLFQRSVHELTSFQRALSAPEVYEGRRIGPYEVIRELGRGGMAVVYLARRADGKFEQQVAIKILDRFHSAAAGGERFRQEWRVLGQLETPHIAKILDAGSDDGLAYFVMEYIDGSPIDRYCRERSLSLEQRLELFLGVCEAVAIAHGGNIVHRDLKPANILVDQSGNPKLIDFGIAKMLDTRQEAALTVRGFELMTLVYASPEQIAGDTDLANLPSCDIYSLGVVLYELLTGRRPLNPPEEMALTEVPRYLVETEPELASKWKRELAGDLDTILLKALHKDWRKRFRSVGEFASYIRLYLEDRPLPERKTALAYTAGKFLRRNRTPLAVSTALMLTIGLGVAATLQQAQIAQRRFDDVRRLATSFLFEFDGAIANVPGATEARRLVVAKGLEYLDKLSRDSAGDDSLRTEIAAAFERLAGIQGNVFASNLGEYEQAAATYERALAIRKDLAARNPRDQAAQKSLGSSHLQLADGWYTKGSSQRSVQEYREGVRILEGISKSGDSSTEVREGLRRGYSRLCAYLLSTGDVEGAIDYCHKNIDVARQLADESKSDPARLAVLAAAYGQTGNALRAKKDLKSSVPYLEMAEKEFAGLVSRQPNNSVFASNLAGAQTILGRTQEAMGETALAAASFQRGVATARQLAKADPKDARARTTLAYSLLQLSALLQKSGRADEALAAGSEGLSIFRRFADRPQASPDDLNNFASFLCDTTVPRLRDPKTALAYSKRAVAAAKTPSLVLLSTLVDAYAGAGDLDNAIATGKRALAETGAPKGGAMVGLRAELEQKLKKFEEQRSKAKSKA